MVQRCVAAGCSNSSKDRISLFRFPKDPERRKNWSDQVKRTRARWEGPTEHSRLGIEHFDGDCITDECRVSEGLGLGPK